MRNHLVGAIAVMAMCAASLAAEPTCPRVVSGKVFLDANKNGTLDPGEKGVPGVRITDGVEFVTTAADGAYTIRISDDPTFPYRPAQTVSVCWPTGTWPSGQWWARLSNVKDAASVHFGLRKDAQKVPFVFLHMTDPHEFFNNGNKHFLEWMNAMPTDVKFMIDTGDTYRPKAVEKPYKLTFITAVGNHDTWELAEPPKDPDDGGYGPFTKRLGPVRWSFDCAGIHFVGVDVIEQRKQSAMIDWLAKDLASVKPGTRVVMAYHYPDPGGDPRFVKLLRDHKVELILGGHGHAYAYSEEGPVPLLTAYHWQPPGTCNVLAVSDKGIAHGVYCLGCKWKQKALGAHSRRCPVRWADHVLVPQIRKLFGTKRTLEAGALQGKQTVTLTEPHVLVRGKIALGRAQRIVVRIGPAQKPLEIAYDGRRLVVDGTNFPFAPRPAQKTLDLTVFVHHKMLTLWANNFFFIEKSVPLTKATAVTLAAEGGPATVESMTVQEIKPDPANRSTSYFCPCAHGAVRRVPLPR